MDERPYTCICGKEFTNPQSFNSHKSLCKEHYIQKYSSLTEYEMQQEKRHKAAAESLHKKAACKKQSNLDIWIAEQHVCERCGKVMTEKFGSGRFCSRACANARDHSAETKEKIRQALVKPEELKKKRVRPKVDKLPRDKVIKEPNTCVVCGVTLGKHSRTGYCAAHLKEHKRQLKIQHWLETGDIGLKPDSTIRGGFRDYILEEQNDCCAICGMPAVWNSKPLAFILDHIDGDASNSTRDNLRLICPNCDSQLDTYKAKNKNSARTSRKKYLQEIRNLDR